MIKVGWLVETSEGIEFASFDQHMSQSAKKRAQEQRKKAIQRQKAADRVSPTVTPLGGDIAGTDKGTREEREKSISPYSPPRGTDGVLDSLFETWWQVSHVQVGKAAAQRQFTKTIGKLVADESRGLGLPELAAAFLSDRMKLYAKSRDAKPDDRQPIKPSTWLSQGRYDDDETTWGLPRRPQQQRTKSPDEIREDIVFRGRRSGKTEDQINEELVAAGVNRQDLSNNHERI